SPPFQGFQPTHPMFSRRANELPFDEILWEIYVESPTDWDTDTAVFFLGSAVYGVCPEHADAMDKWIDEL
ncbi:MAG: hypothetical protein OXS29_16970, partial [bacterium]|nr:hypothetical protein [bacterium]